MAEQNLPTSAEQAQRVTPDAIMQLGTAFWGSKALLSAVELKVFQELCETPDLKAATNFVTDSAYIPAVHATSSMPCWR